MKARKPLKITGFTAGAWLTQRYLLTNLENFRITSAKLENNKLDLSGKHSFSIATFSGKEIASQPGIWNDYYFSEPVSGLPAVLRKELPIPYACDRFAWFRSRLWLARMGSRTPLHRDIPHNLILVTEGAKDVLLVAPRAGAGVYPYSFFSKAPNFARVDLRNPDAVRFPKSKGLSVIHTIVEAGEMIYIPPFWWHDILNLKKTTSLNHWFAPANLNGLLAATSFYLKKIIGIYKHEWVKPRTPGSTLTT